MKKIVSTFLIYVGISTVINVNGQQILSKQSYSDWQPNTTPYNWGSLDDDDIPARKRLKKSIRIEANTSYKKENDSYSDYYWREIVFVSGEYLNQETQHEQIDDSKTYVMIWFSQSEVAIIELEQKIFQRLKISQDSFDFSCKLSNYYLKGKQINSDSPREWKFCMLGDDMKNLCQ